MECARDTLTQEVESVSNFSLSNTDFWATMVYFVCWGGSLYLNRLDNLMFSLADDVQVICLRGPRPTLQAPLPGLALPYCSP